MAFSSFNFLLILPLFVLIFWALPLRFQRPWLVLISLFVYMAAGWQDLALLLGAVWVNWAVQRWGTQPRQVAHLMVIANVAFLGWFKYRGFVGGWLDYRVAALVIPLGISFYIFQLISYQVEIARGELDPRQRFWNFFLYIFFFPHHQAGPIMRPKAFLICFTQPRTWYRSRWVTGLLIFLWGLMKKVWIADQIAPQVDAAFQAFHLSNGHSGNLISLGITFGIQVYGDFSGYSDMAVGMGRLFGYKFDRNFHQPYTARGASEFWRRWHVTLSQWLRDFLYIPMGGNRHGEGRTLSNLLLTMMIGGLWHGAGWNFLLWGTLHGLYLVWERKVPLPDWAWLRWPRYLFFQLVVMLAWVPFRESSFEAIWNALPRASAWVGSATDQALKLWALMLAFSFLERALERRFVSIFRWTQALPRLAFAVAYGVVLYFVLLGAGSAKTFIYQRF